MGLEGFYNLGGIEIDNSYIRITRYQVRTSYSRIGDTTSFAKYLNIDYDYNMYKDKANADTNHDSYIKQFLRNRVTHQLVPGATDNIWQIIYDDIGTKQLFRDFLPDED